MIASLIVTLILVGVLLFVINEILPMDAKIKRLVNVIVIVAACLWVLEGFGLLPNLGANHRWFR